MTDNSDNMSNEDMQSSSLRVIIDMMGRERPDRRDRLLYSPGSKTRRGGADVSVRKQGVSKARKRGDKVGPSLSLMVPSNVFLYKPEAELPDLTAYFSQTIEVKIEKKYITRDNPNVIKRKIWGSENYTSNSDIVCILLHFNQFNIDEFLSQKARDGINFFLTVGKPKKTYNSAEKDGFVTRKYNQINNFQGHSLKPVDFKYTQGTFGESVATLSKFAEKMIINKKPRKANNPQNVSDALNPPSAPILSQHTSFDVARLSSFPIPASNLIYNQNNDLAYTYSLCNICDKGRDHKHWLCYVLKNQVLYLDTYDNRRFEISKVNPQHQNIFGDYNTFMVAEVIEPWRFSAEVMENENVPLGACNVDIIFNEIEWSKLQWGDSSILIEDSKANNNYRIKELISYKFYPNKVIAKPDIISLD